ncbi:MAG: iron complex transport system substrate-binding protein [Acidobacteriota bacterium]|jgi:iron complex transport system substrate-binding protein
MSYPQRIVCLTEETTETLYLLGEGDRVVGISGYTVRPPEARQKPKISSFLHARYEKIEALKPDLILAFSDLQAEITNDLVKKGYSVFTFNQRSVAEILQMIRVLAGIVGVAAKGEALAATLERDLDVIRERAARRRTRPKVFFEEWYDPLISGIRWTEELVQMAGGDPIFPELANASLAKDRIVTGEQVIARAPDVIIGSWCGKPVRKERIAARPGWDQVPAVKNGHIYEVKSTYILQPGPAALTEGVAQIERILARI